MVRENMQPHSFATSVLVAAFQKVIHQTAFFIEAYASSSTASFLNCA